MDDKIKTEMEIQNELEQLTIEFRRESTITNSQTKKDKLKFIKNKAKNLSMRSMPLKGSNLYTEIVGLQYDVDQSLKEETNKSRKRHLDLER
ncbi:hypothetical protein MHB50_13830 [Siminovitchia sp. FSL H7-0308]|uniref:Uncharacterized protein YlaN (UPF0358 family) n=1 Tax=Siminovitchia thermophila TaxID=1245522 RepID=A0ABS2R3T5_9BACI|nr:hypothetical protein [Siminovitchia thermophila]MBM7713281.1 uncharacterized protein YlaN (UPF0358 family) [Siminovitchia thermophila]ONK24264.1 hypothetical protein BLX87_06220 [Bacillus sp. VT-16-64]